MTLTGEVLEVDEPSLLAFSWGEETLRFELTPDGDGTALALIDELRRVAQRGMRPDGIVAWTRSRGWNRPPFRGESALMGTRRASSR